MEQPPSVARRLRRKAGGAKARLKARLAPAIARPLARSERLSGLYYAALPDAFGREHKAVLAGKYEYERIREAGSQRYLLRRNVHMLEKGLSMRPRREVFATDYIEDTVSVYRSLTGEVAGAAETDRELQWANDVLSSYFDAANGHPAIERARSRFEVAPLGVDIRAPKPGLAPYLRDLGRPVPVAYNDLLELAQRRRSVRWFEQRPVPRELIEQAMEVGGLSPSACNRQPFEFRVFDDPELVQQVADVPMGTRGWRENIPMFVVIVGTLSAFFSERDRHLIYTDGCLAAMSFLLALETLGLSTCCVNWPDIAEREARMAELLQLRADERPIMCIAIGYPDESGMVPFSHKKPLHQLVRFNFE